MATVFETMGIAASATPRHSAPSYYRGVELTPDTVAVDETSHPGRVMFYRDVTFNGAQLDRPASRSRRPQFYRGVFF